jgi:hypothetical protein
MTAEEIKQKVSVIISSNKSGNDKRDEILRLFNVKQSLPERPKCENCFDTGGSWQGDYGYKYVKCTMCGDGCNVV